MFDDRRVRSVRLGVDRQAGLDETGTGEDDEILHLVITEPGQVVGIEIRHPGRPGRRPPSEPRGSGGPARRAGRPALRRVSDQ